MILHIHRNTKSGHTKNNGTSEGSGTVAMGKETVEKERLKPGSTEGHDKSS